MKSERIRSVLAVAFLTIAVWVWADLEQTGEAEQTVGVVVDVPQGYVLRGVQPERITVRFKGPLGEIQDLRTSTDDLVCRFTLTEAELKTGRLVLPAREGFSHWKNRRVVVTATIDDDESIPDGEIHVLADRLVRLQVRVQPQVTGAVAVAVAALPPEVVARVPESLLKNLPEAKRFAVAPLAVTSVPAGLTVEREVPLDRRLGGPDGVEATFDPPIVKVTARLESTLVTKTLEKRFPVCISAPPEVLNRYRIVFQSDAERWVQLDVEGPAPDIERLNLQDIRVELVLTEDDKPDPGSWLPGKPLVVGLPPSVKLAKPLPTINFNLEKQAEAPAAP
jgi:hypothetical protein